MTDTLENISSLIDSLNDPRAGETPTTTGDKELAELIDIAAGIKSLPHLELPNEDYLKKVAAQMRVRKQKNKQSRFRSWFTPVGVVAAGLSILCLLLSPWPFFSSRDEVLAMGEKVKGLTDYHGILEMRTVTGDNQSWLVRRAEIWNQGEKYAIKDQDGVWTVNNGERRWQVQPREKLITLLPLLPDPIQGRFDLQAEANRALNYPHMAIGKETISGRTTAKVKISPAGGQPYHIWIDEETRMPVQLETAMQNSVQTVYTMLELDINKGIAADIFSYRPDPEYKVVGKDAGTPVSTLDEAVAVAGFTPVVPKDSPSRILAAANRIVLDYNGTLLTETKTEKPWELAFNAAVGKADGAELEVTGYRLRWQHNGIEFSIEGPKRLVITRQMVNNLALPAVAEDFSKDAKVTVPVNLEQVKNEQQQVDGGHSPWNLDPVQVSLVFINTELAAKPEVAFEGIKVELNTGSQAVCTVKNGPVTKVYLKRAVRQDESGIWSVVGYDPS